MRMLPRGNDGEGGSTAIPDGKPNGAPWLGSLESLMTRRAPDSKSTRKTRPSKLVTMNAWWQAASLGLGTGRPVVTSWQGSAPKAAGEPHKKTPVNKKKASAAKKRP